MLGRAEVDSIEASIQGAFVTADGLQWRSHDPFDLLLSPFLGRWQSSPVLARVAVQVGKRSGTGLRSVLRVPMHEEPKAIADFLRAAVILSSCQVSWAQGLVEPLMRRLLASGGLTGGAWGLGFPYASRFVNAPGGTPNIYVVTAVLDALLDASTLTDEDALLEVVRRGCGFMLGTLGTFDHDGRRWLRYWPASDDRIINVQASAAALLSRAAARLNDDQLGRAADEAAETTLGAQRPDGSWSYSDEGRALFVDGFHTGFVLQGLTEYAAQRRYAGSAIAAAIDLGFGYFKARLLSDGMPRGVTDGNVSLDPQNVAQCVQTLIVCAKNEADVEAGIRVWVGAARLGDSPLRPRSRLLSLRWSLGPGALAASHLFRRLSERPPARLEAGGGARQV